MIATWYLARGKRKVGPFSAEQMRRMADLGQLAPQDMVLRAGDSKRAPAGSVPEIFPAPEALPAAQAAGRQAGPPPAPDDEDRLEGHWYAVVWLSLLVPYVGTWVIVVLSSVLYYRWRGTHPRKARAVNLNGWLAFAAAHTVCCLAWVGQWSLAAGAFGEGGGSVRVNGGEVLYTEAITRDQAARLGDFLAKEGLFDGDPKTAKLHREGRTYQLRVVVKKGLEQDAEVLAVMRRLAARASSEVFGSAPVDVHLCDDGLNTLRVVLAAP